MNQIMQGWGWAGASASTRRWKGRGSEFKSSRGVASRRQGVLPWLHHCTIPPPLHTHTFTPGVLSIPAIT